MPLGYSIKDVSFSFQGRSSAGIEAEPEWCYFEPGTARYLSIPAALNEERVRGVIDTGASRSVIGPGLLARAGLNPSGSTLVTMFTARYPVSLFRARSLRAGAISLSDIDVACHDLTILEDAFPDERAMLIGQDVLTRGVLECQFPRRRARITSALSQDASAGYAELEVMLSRHGLPTVGVEVESGLPQQAFLDLGSHIVCSVSEQYAEEAGLLSRPISTTMTAGLEGSVVGRQITLRSLKIGNHVLREVPACIIPDWKLDAPLNLGWPAFAAFDLAFIFGRELRIRADEDILAVPLPRDRCGIGAQRFPNHLLVRHIALGSPAEEQGMVAGDTILAIDGRSVDRCYPARGASLGRQAAGTKISLALAWGRQVDLVLRDYF